MSIEIKRGIHFIPGRAPTIDILPSTKKNNLAFPPKISSHFARGYQKHQLTIENPEDFLRDQFTLRNSQVSLADT